MSETPSSNEGSLEGRTLPALFAEYLAAFDDGQDPDIVDWCEKYPEAAEGLLNEHSRWQAQNSMVDDLGFTDSIADARLTSIMSEGSGFRRRVFERLEPRRASFSRYKVGDEIGRGGMGSVHEVWDEDLRRRLAMKVIRTQGKTPRSSASEHQLARFVEEAQISGQLEHPGIVPVHELGLDSEGQVFFTMKLVKGMTLGELLKLRKQGSTEWSEVRVLNILLRVCEALAFAHDKGVVHRDLKPSNVMIGDFGEVYVLDWGLALILGGEGDAQGTERSDEGPIDPIQSDRVDHRADTPGSAVLTGEGQAIGTAMYSSPEQANGQQGLVGKASDVYSIGAMLYELLAGQPPHIGKGENPSRETVLERARRGAPVNVLKLAPRAPLELVAISERAMARDVANRYASVGEVSSELIAYLDGRVVLAFESGSWAETKKWVRRNKGLATAVGTTILALVAGLVASWSLNSALRTSVSETEVERDRLSAAVVFLEEMFAGLDPAAFGAQLRSGFGDEQAGASIVPRHSDISEERRRSYGLRSEAISPTSAVAGGVNFTNLGVQAIRRELLDPARERLDETFDGDPLTKAVLMGSLSKSYRRLGFFGPALDLELQVLELRRIELAGDHPTVLTAIGNVGSLLLSMGDAEKAMPYYKLVV